MKYGYKKVDLSLDDINTISKKIKKATAIANKQLADTFDYKEDTGIIEIIEANYQTDKDFCEIDIKAKHHIIGEREYFILIPAAMVSNVSDEFLAGFLVSNSLVQYKIESACNEWLENLEDEYDYLEVDDECVHDEIDEVEYE